MTLGHWANGLSIATKSLILDRELEELTGRRHIVRQPEKTAEPTFSTGRSHRVFADRWRMPIDLRWPSPGPSERPTTSAGSTSFHMRVTTWSRPADGGASLNKPSSGSGHGAASFDIYVTDGLAIRQVDGAAFDRYAADGLSPHDPEPDQGSRVAFMITNIDDDPDKRTGFWEERHLAARRRGDHAIELVPGRGSIEQWRALEEDKSLPANVSDAVAKIIAALEGEHLARDRRPMVKTQRVCLEAAPEITWAANLGERFGAEKTKRMLHYVRPRGGQIQQRFEVELPTGLDRTEIVQIASGLAMLVEKLKLPFLIAVHRPDADNDRRNWHLHLIYYPQPGERDPDGIWMFGKAANGEGMLRPGDIARSLNRGEIVAPDAGYKRGAAADLRALRESYADICNTVLERVGDRRRLDARSLAGMGVAKAPERHLGTDEARLFFAGVATATSRVNATRRWEWIIRQRQAEIDASCDRLMAPLEARRDIADVGEDLRRERDRLVAEREALAADRRELALADARVEIARSSAKRVKANCEQTLERIVQGNATRSDIRSEHAIRSRLRLAEHHLVEIADAVEPWTDQMEAFRRGLERREEALRDGVQAWSEQAREQSHTWKITPFAQCAEAEDIADEHSREVGPVAADPPTANRAVEVLAGRQPTMAPRPNERLEIDRLLAAVRANGIEATRTATRGKTSTPRADAMLYQRYRTHPDFLARVAPAEREWTEKVIREADEIGRRIAAMIASASTPAGRPYEALDPTIPSLPSADPPSSIAGATGGFGPAVAIPIAPIIAEETKARVAGADSMRRDAEAVVNDEPISGIRRELAEPQAGESTTVSIRPEPPVDEPVPAPSEARASEPADGHGTTPGTPAEAEVFGQAPADQIEADSVPTIRDQPSADGLDLMVVFDIEDDVARHPTTASSSVSGRMAVPEKTTDLPKPPMPAAAQDGVVEPSPALLGQAEWDEYPSTPTTLPSAAEADDMCASPGKAEPLLIPTMAAEEKPGAPDLGPDVSAPISMAIAPIEPAAAGRDARRDAVAKAPLAAAGPTDRKPTAVDAARAAAAARSRPDIAAGIKTVQSAVTPRQPMPGKYPSVLSPATQPPAPAGRNAGTSGPPNRTPPMARRNPRYPDPRDAATRQVRVFITFLHEDAPVDQLRAAARAIAREPAADQDVRRHRIALRDAYLDHLEGADPFDPSQRRNQGVDRS